MTSVTDTSQAPPATTPTEPRQHHRPRRGRGGRNSEAGGEVNTPTDGTESGDRSRGGRRGGRGRGSSRGRGNRGNQEPRELSSTLPAPSVPPPPLRGTFGARLTEDATKFEGEAASLAHSTKGKELGGEDVEAEICFICASDVVYNAVSPCNHRTCHICALRLRALYKTKACAHCRTQADFVILTREPVKRYEDYSDNDFAKVDGNLGIKYEKPEIFEDTVLLLRYNCPDPSCDVACLGWPDLHRHVKSVHHKMMCDLCTRNKKVFTHEHELFTPAELRRHERFGDDNPGAIDQSGFKGHPECGFCRQRFYGDDELYAHCRDRHERCHICDRHNQGQQHQYYVNYDALEQHFRKDHFLCPDQECLDKKFVVFDSELDLKAHQLEVHPNGLTKEARRDARRADMSSFAFRDSYQQSRGGRRGGREGREGSQRGRDPNAEPLPVSSAQPLRRDELAYQRQMAIQSAQSVSTRTFGGQLTSARQSAPRATTSGPEPPTVNARVTARDEAFPSLAALNLGSNAAQPTPTRDLPPQEQARQLRHNAVTERAANLLKNDQTKLSEFRSKISSFRNSNISAADLIDGFFALFDAPSKELGKLIKELADIFEVQSKREDLLKAWNDWRAINEDYPTLPGPSGGPSNAPTAPISGGGSRVLKLKSSTAKSSRSSVSQQGSWGSTATSSLFPPLGSGAAASINRAGAGRVGLTPWASSTSNSPRQSPAPSRAPSRPAPSRTAVADPEAFPALPVTSKPTSTVFSPGYGGSAVRRVPVTQNPSNPWGNGAASSSASTPAQLENEAEAPTSQKKRGNKNKKQTLFHFG